jgi:hypothetical protein
MSLIAMVVSSALAGSPFPAPPTVAIDETLKFASGRVISVDASAGTAMIETAIGPVRFHTGDAAGAAALEPGKAVYVWYRFASGALALEIAPAPPPDAAVIVVSPPMTPESLKSAAGTIASVDQARERLILMTPAGPVLFALTSLGPPEVVGADGRALDVRALSPAERVRVWYFVSNGARVKKIEMLDSASRPAVSSMP